MNAIKRFLSMLLVFVMLLSALPITSAASAQKNTGVRHELCLKLSDQANDYYTGDYSYDRLSALAGDGSGSCLSAIDSALYKELQTLMKSTMSKSVSYSSLTDYWPNTDANNGSGNAVLFYSDVVSSSYNREHVWPKSRASFFEANGGCDLHHLRPTNTNVNSDRSNYTMGNVRNVLSSYTTKTFNEKDVLYYNGSYKDSDGASGLVEVNDNIKGDVARILLYVYVRWEEPNLFEDDPDPRSSSSDEGGNNGMKVIESLDTLLQWCEMDPVDTWEMARNDSCQGVQGNRNVFIDYPEFAWLLFGREIPVNMDTPSGGASACEHTQTSTTTVAATCTENGYKKVICDSCGRTLSNYITYATGHSYVSGVCSVCGEKESATYFQLITDPENITDGEYFFMVAPANYNGSFNYFAMVREAYNSTYVKAKGYSYDTLPNSIKVTDNTLIWKLTGTADSFKLTDPDGTKVLRNSDNSLYYGAGTASAWKGEYSTSRKTFTISSSGHSLGLRDEINNTDADGYPLFRCNSSAQSSSYYFYVYRRGGADGSVTSCEHTVTYEKTEAPTCTETGTLSRICSDCGEILSTEDIAALGHTEVTDPAVAPGCITSGLTEGSHCGVCNIVIIAQDTIPATGHSYANGICTVCGTPEGVGAFRLVTSSDELTDGEYIFVVIPGGSYSGDYGYYALKQQASGGYVYSQGLVFDELPDTMDPTDDSVVWSLTRDASGFKLTGSNDSSVLYNSSNKLYYGSGNASTWTGVFDASNNTFLIKASSRYLGLRDDLSSTGENGTPLFRCNSSASTSSYDFYLYKKEVAPAVCTHINTDSVTVPATCTAEGSVTVTCTKCGFVVSTTILPKKDHSYSSGVCSVCGAIDDSFDAYLDESLVIFSKSLNLQSYIGVDFMVRNNIVSNYDSFYVAVSVGDREEEVLEGVPYGSMFTFFELKTAAPEMTEALTATVYAEKDGAVYHGNPVVWTVRDGIMDKIAAIGDLSNETNLLQMKLMVDMLNYGAAAQTCFNNRTDDLANSKLTEEQLAYATTSVPSLSETITETATGASTVTFFYKTLALQSAIEMQFMVKIPSYTYSELEAHISYNGETVVKDLQASVSGYAMLLFGDLASKELRTPVSITIYDKATAQPVSVTLNCSVAALANTMVNTQADMIYAMMRYGDSAAAYYK